MVVIVFDNKRYNLTVYEEEGGGGAHKSGSQVCSRKQSSSTTWREIDSHIYKCIKYDL